MNEELAAPWWRMPLKIAAIVFGLVALAALLMTLIVLTARLFEWLSKPAPAQPVFIAPPQLERNARTHVPGPNDPQWPDSPARRPAVGRLGAGGAGGGVGGRPAAPPAEAAVPVGVSVEAYREAVASGKTLYIPNPQGNCELSGAQSANALDECFAQRVAR